MMISHEVTAAASADALWALTLDVEGWPRMSPTMTAVQRLDEGPIRVGSSARVSQPGQPVRVWKVTELLDEPGHKRFVWRTRGPGLVMTGGHELTTVPEGCRNVLTLDMRGPLGAVLGVVARPLLTRALTQENAGFKAAAETP